MSGGEGSAGRPNGPNGPNGQDRPERQGRPGRPERPEQPGRQDAPEQPGRRDRRDRSDGRRPHRRLGRKAKAGQPRQRLPMRETVVAAARAGRRDWWQIIAVAVVVSTVTALLQVSVDHFVDPDNALLAIVLTVSAEASSLLGTVLLSGFLTRLVGAAERGKERVSVWQVIRSLPWGRLILADLLVTLLVILGFVALVIPGLVILNLLAIVGPVIEIEDRRVFPALRRSAQLVRRHFWPVALLATLPLIVVSEVELLHPESSSVPAILQAIAVRGVLEAVLEAAVGLMLVELCYRLIDLDRREVATPKNPASADPASADPASADPARGGQARG